jgi:hypothetical protein
LFSRSRSSSSPKKQRIWSRVFGYFDSCPAAAATNTDLFVGHGDACAPKRGWRCVGCVCWKQIQPVRPRQNAMLQNKSKHGRRAVASNWREIDLCSRAAGGAFKPKDSEKNTTQPCAFKCAKTNLRLIFIYVIELNLSRPKKLLPPAAGWSILFISHLSSNTRIYGPRAEKFAGAPPASRCIRLYYDS